jgi:hypothetical protein
MKEDGMGGECSTHGRDENAYEVLVRKPEGKRPLGRPRRKWDGNTGKEIRCESCGLDSSGSEQGPMADCCELDNESSSSIRGGEFLD